MMIRQIYQMLHRSLGDDTVGAIRAMSSCSRRSSTAASRASRWGK
ncbi:hypothetical protein [Streptomyces sp. NPDC058486]